MRRFSFRERLLITCGLVLFGIVAILAQYVLFHMIHQYMNTDWALEDGCAEVLASLIALTINPPLIAAAIVLAVRTRLRPIEME